MFLITGMSVNAQMHGNTHHGTKQDSDDHISGYYCGNQGGHMMSYGMMHHGMAGHMGGNQGTIGHGMGLDHRPHSPCRFFLFHRAQ